MRVRVRIVSSPSGPFTVTECSSIPTASVPVRISTPIFSRRLCVYACSFGANGGSTEGAPSSSRIRASVVSIDR